MTLRTVSSGIGTNGGTVNGDLLFGSGGDVKLSSNGLLTWSSGTAGVDADDVILSRDPAGTDPLALALRNGTNSQRFHVYRTYTDANNYERGFMAWSGVGFYLGCESNGTGTSRKVIIYSDGGYVQVAPDGTVVYEFTPTYLSGTVLGVDLGTTGLGWKRLYIDYTNTGTVGAVTINKAAGRVNIAAAGTSVVVTNSLVTAASKVFAVISTNDTTALLKNVVPAAGSFTIRLNAAATAQTSIDFFVVNAD